MAMNFDPLIKARAKGKGVALDPLWEESDVKGRPWGLKRPGNPYALSNILLVIGDEVVLVCQLPDGRLEVHEFRKARHTLLGTRARKALRDAGLRAKRRSRKPKAEGESECQRKQKRG